MSADRAAILVVDDEETMRDVLRARLENWGFEVLLTEDAAGAEEVLRRENPWLVLSDVVLPDASGIELLRTISRSDALRPVVLITAYGTVDVAVEAMKLGARDFLTKPLDYQRLHALLHELARESERRRETHAIEQSLADGDGLGGLLGTSRAMREVLELARRIAESDTFVLISGESGTGKELLARLIHDLGARRGGPFVAINAAAIPEGLTESELFGHERGAFTGAVGSRAGVFEQAHGGTLLLDEIAEMPISLQPKLLRVIEQRRTRRLGGSREIQFDVRVLAATNREPEVAIREGRLREDLYYRLGVFAVKLPPLRERDGDIPLLAQHFVRHFDRKHGLAVEGLSWEALERMSAFRWPGNVRELRNVVERAVVLAKRGWIETSHLPPYVREPPADLQGEFVLPADVTAQDAERQLILQTLERVDYNKAEAARRLGLDVKTIRNRLHAYGLKVHRR